MSDVARGKDAMRRTTSLLVATLVVTAALASIPMGALAATAADATTEDEQTVPTETQNETKTNASANGTVSPGQQLAGVLGVQQAEIEGEIELRAFGLRVANASNETRAEAVAEEANASEERLAELEAERERLEAARENGSIAEGQYRARLAKLAAEVNTTERVINATGTTAEGLPADLLERKGVNVTAIQTLRSQAENMTGPEVASVARSIAGPDVGQGLNEGGPDVDRSNRQGGERPSDAEEANAERTSTPAGDSREGSGSSDGTATGSESGDSRGSGASQRGA